jgi:hypothetical protein
VQFEQWRREAFKLKNHQEFKHWHDLLESTPPPSWGKTQSAGRPEPRGKFRVSRTKRTFAQVNWFDHVFDALGLKEQPRAARNVWGASTFGLVLRALSSQPGILDWYDAVSLLGGDGNIPSIRSLLNARRNSMRRSRAQKPSRLLRPAYWIGSK